MARLPLYLRVLTTLAEGAVHTVSSDTLAAATGVTPAKVRKDLSHLGSFGTRGVGYEVDVLLDCIAARLGLTEDRAVVLVGVGNLGHALAGYAGFHARGFRIVALVDADPDRVGERVGEVVVRPVDELERVIDECAVTIGVVCTPAAAAQRVCDRLVAAGVTSILNFAPTVLSVPEGVDVRKVDLAVELQILSFHEARKRPASPREQAPGRPAPAEQDGPDGVAARGSWSSRVTAVPPAAVGAESVREPLAGAGAGSAPALPTPPPGELATGEAATGEAATGEAAAAGEVSSAAGSAGAVSRAETVPRADTGLRTDTGSRTDRVSRADRMRTETDGVVRVTRQAVPAWPAQPLLPTGFGQVDRAGRPPAPPWARMGQAQPAPGLPPLAGQPLARGFVGGGPA
nr:redox-sensing transcriptional repressor Rex [Frankia sp. AgB32]